MTGITLSAGVRDNLLSLQRTADLISTTQGRLATGKKVNSALDNPFSFFKSQSMSNRASDLTQLLDSMNNAVNTVQSADQAISAITKLVESAQATARRALDEGEAVPQQAAIAATGAVGGAANKAAAEALTLNDAAIDIDDGDTITIGSGANTFTYTVADASTETVAELVAAIDASSVASASLDAGGRLSITAADAGETLSVSFVSADGANSAGASDAAIGLGFYSDQTTATSTATGTAGTPTVTQGVNTTDVDTTTLTVAAPAAVADALRTSLKAEFNTIRSQIDRLVEDATFNGTNLLQNDDLKVVFNEKVGAAQSSLTISGVDFGADALNVDEIVDQFTTDAGIEGVIGTLTSTIGTLRSQAASFGTSLSVVQIRQDFTKEIVNTLTKGSDELVLADTNQEGANLLALQTRQQLSSTALSLASQADQNVLRLF